MKKILIIMLSMLPAWALAQAEITTYTDSPMIEDGKDITILITFANYSTNAIQVPKAGGPDKNGYLRPSDTILFSAEIFALVDKEPCCIGGMGMGVDHGSDTTQPLLPYEKVTYKEIWRCDFGPDRAINAEKAMFILTPRFNSFDYKIPSITLYYDKQSNQGVDPTSADAQSVVP